MSQQRPQLSHRQFAERMVIGLLIVGIALLLWQLRGLLILVFGAILLGVILSATARPFARRLGLPHWIALLIAVLLLLGVFGVAAWLFGAEAARQAGSLTERVPNAWAAVQARLDAWGLGGEVNRLLERIEAGGGVMSNLGGVATSITSAIADTFLVLIGGIYLAARPDLYRGGILKLVPERGRPLAAQALDDSGRALRLWLLGRLVSMTFVGVCIGIGLWLIGVPAAFALAILSALLDFVPYIGPIAAAIPAVLLALAIGPDMALWTAALYFVVQQIEGNLVDPLAQQRAVELPPALLLFSLVAGGLLFGIVGIIFAAPLTVVLYVLVKRLYVREALHTPTHIPGEEAD